MGPLIFSTLAPLACISHAPHHKHDGSRVEIDKQALILISTPCPTDYDPFGFERIAGRC